jgi:hypothetical protein
MSQRHSYQTIVSATMLKISRQTCHALMERLIVLSLEWRQQHDVSPRHPVLPTTYPNLQVKNQPISFFLSGNALCLLKTQFAKKPKNPV